MEYSVFDLVRALLKKWYVIVLVMALVSGASVFTSRASYEKALADYEAYTTETIPTGETGTLTVSVGYDYSTFMAFSTSAIESACPWVFSGSRRIHPGENTFPFRALWASGLCLVPVSAYTAASGCSVAFKCPKGHFSL